MFAGWVDSHGHNCSALEPVPLCGGKMKSGLLSQSQCGGCGAKALIEKVFVEY
jgi:hypothetical protein